MKNHVWRPLWVVLVLVGTILLVRWFWVPKDFGVHQRGYMYGYYRGANVQDWKEQVPKYRTIVYCDGCHDDKVATQITSPHAVIPCENCHGPALQHPDAPEALPIDRSRDLCLRCHVYLPYPSSGRSLIVGIDPIQHNPDFECSDCHNPHHPNLEEM